MPTISEVLQQGVALQQAGQNAEAARLYEAVLRADPQQPDALHLLGLVTSQQGEHARAIELIEHALLGSPNNAVFLGNLGVVLRKAGRIDEAVAAYRSAIALDDSGADAHFNLGKSLKLQGDLAGAQAEFERAIELEPHKAAAWLSLTNLSAEKGDLDAAIALARQAVDNCPKSAEAHLNYGVMLKRAEQTEEALACFNRAAELRPDNVDALCRLAGLLILRRRHNEGRRLIDRALAIDPNSSEVNNALGIWHKAMGDGKSAIDAFRKAVDRDPEYGAGHSNLATVLREMGNYTEALVHVTKGLELQPGSSEAMVNYAGVLMGIGRLDEAVANMQKAINSRGGYHDAHDCLLMCLQYQPGVTPEKLAESHALWNRLYGRESRSIEVADRNPERRLRLGFVSADLGCHPVGYFSVRMFELLDRNRFTTFVYSDRAAIDLVGKRIAATAGSWRECASWPEEELVKQIRSDQIDILFDLAGHTGYNRLLMFAHRAAPVQISWAGYVGTTGVDAMDYLLADRHHIPPGEEQHYSEHVLRMPDGYICYDGPKEVPEVVPLPALKKGYVQFASMCNPSKVNPDVIKTWGEILRRLPMSKLLLSYGGWPDAANRRRVLDVIGDFVEDAESRISFEHNPGYLSLMARYGDVDLALDTFPYSGGLTTCEALWMGVPTITLPGQTFAGRHSFSHMMNVGLPEFVAASAEEYVANACEWANDLDRLAKLRGEMRERVATSPLCDGPRFTRNFEQICRDAWRAFCDAS